MRCAIPGIRKTDLPVSLTSRPGSNHFRNLTLILSLCLKATCLRAQGDYLEKPKVAAVPLINYNKSFGGIFGAIGAVFFPINKKDTLSPASCAGGGGIYTTNKTWFGLGFARLYYGKDHYRNTIAAGTGNINFQFFYESNIVPGTFIQYTTTNNFFFVEQLVKVYGRVFTGIDYVFFKVNTTFSDLKLDSASRNYAAIGIPVTVDTRDNVMNPSAGWLSNARLNRFDALLGSTTEFTKLDADISHYKGWGKGNKVPHNTHIVAWKASVSTAIGAVPFEAQTVVGGNIIRGYSEGKYRGDQVYATQVEYRWNFYKKFGLVLFGGMATPVSSGETWDINYLLPAGGGGIRYMMIPSIRLNAGFDAAVGKGDYGLYFRIWEAF